MPALEVFPGRCQSGYIENLLELVLFNGPVLVFANTAPVSENLENIHLYPIMFKSGDELHVASILAADLVKGLADLSQ